MASPRPSFGIGITAMAARAGGIERAQMREQVRGGFDEIAAGERLSDVVQRRRRIGPNASSASPARTSRAFRRSGVRGA